MTRLHPPAIFQQEASAALLAPLYNWFAMQQGIREQRVQFVSQGRPVVEARVGVNSGEVVVRIIETSGHTEYTPIGLTANLAARLQTAASPGSIAVSARLRRLCDGYFSFRALGHIAFKGIGEPVDVYELTGAGPLRSHFELSTQRGLTKFVGRDAELGQMRRGMERIRCGHGQLIAVVAEPGAGKSRLVYEFKAILRPDCKVLEAYSVSHGKGSAWLPVLELLRGYLDIRSTDDSETRREKVRAKLPLQLLLSGALMALKGGSVPEAGQALNRANELCRQLASTRHLFRVVNSLATFHTVRGDWRRACEFAQEAVAIAEQRVAEKRGGANLLVAAHVVFGPILRSMGKLSLARGHPESTISLYDPRTMRSDFDPGVFSLGWAGRTRGSLGYPDQGFQRSQQALTLARELALPHALANALLLAVDLHVLRREGEIGLAMADELLCIASEHGFEQLFAWGMVVRGQALIELDRSEEGIELLVSGIAASRATGCQLLLAFYLGTLGYGPLPGRAYGGRPGHCGGCLGRVRKERRGVLRSRVVPSDRRIIAQTGRAGQIE